METISREVMEEVTKAQLLAAHGVLDELTDLDVRKQDGCCLFCDRPIYVRGHLACHDSECIILRAAALVDHEVDEIELERIESRIRATRRGRVRCNGKPQVSAV